MIATSRLVLRPPERSDVDDLVALGRHREVTRFVASLDHRGAQERVAAAQREWSERGHGMLVILERASERLLGRAGLKYWPHFDETEVGWVLRRDAWGRGYATEAGEACVAWGFANLAAPYLTAMIHPANPRSIRVAERLGFAPRRRDLLQGDPVIVYVLERGSWELRGATPSEAAALAAGSRAHLQAG
jgi:RimJ/RimL family protein N-acetyltransferase